MSDDMVTIPKSHFNNLVNDAFSHTSSPKAKGGCLTVSEAERLAKAGIKVSLEDTEIVSDEKKPYFPEQRNLMEPLIHRMHQAFPLSPVRDEQPRFRYMSAYYCNIDPSGIGAQSVALFVVTAHGNAQVIEDDIHEWPSDKLFASLRLLLETEPKNNPHLRGLGIAQLVNDTRDQFMSVGPRA